MTSTTTTGSISMIYVGLLGLDLYDSANKELVWRGIASKTLDPKAEPEKQQKNISKAVDNLLKLSVPVILGLIFGICCAPRCSGYAVLTHEAIIDAAWRDSIVPVLLKRFPTATPEQLLQAHAYAYGGAIIQDMGYYPFGNAFFSDLTHYVRGFCNCLD